MWIGLFLILAGILVLLNNMDFLRGDAWDYIWPSFFIILGVSMVIKRVKCSSRSGYYSNGSGDKGSSRNPPPP